MTDGMRQHRAMVLLYLIWRAERIKGKTDA